METLPAWHYDGETGVRHDVELRPVDDRFLILREGVEISQHAWTNLVVRPPRGNSQVFGLKDRGGWQIGFGPDIPADIAAHLPRPVRYGRWIDRVGLIPAVCAAFVVSISSLAGAMTASTWLATRMPSGWEQRLGRNMAGEFTEQQCRGREGEAALAELAKRLSPPGLETHIQVARQQIVNAAALPGGEIVIFDGLLRQAGSADEFAGVLAHEIGHVVHRDTSQSLVRQIALRLVLGGMGGNMGNGLNVVMTASHSREAEAAADRYAIDALRRARISPADTAALFARLQSEEERLQGATSTMSAFSASHPVSDERRTLFAGSFDTRVRYAPALGTDAWNSLADICFNDRRLSEGQRASGR